KPSGWPSLGFLQGIRAGVEVAGKDFREHAAAILIPLLLLAAGMFLLNRWRGAAFSPMLRSVLRVGLGAMFFIAAWPKFTDPEGFSMLVAQYQFLPGPLVYSFSLWLAAFEIVVGLGLIFTPWEREFSAMVGLLLAMFIVAL